MNRRWVTVLVILLVFSFAIPVHALKVLRGRDFYDYVEVRKDRIVAPPGESVHWVLVWNHRRLNAAIFDIPPLLECKGATISLEPQPNFYRGEEGWRLFIKRKGYIKVVVSNPGVAAQCLVTIPCRSYDGRLRDVIPLKIWLIEGNQ
ncbi:MAG: hypothetical protein DRI92_00705 [Aquificota bacterium]|uniref:Uncharacterized protein n=1 Tax=Thermosulfidibacter takaii TaxID=412593 RepID=A0A7C0Y811_9BACT|nr:MAG: hypothetical protein DRI92_00705 [Aquificota bacterium]HDD52766.1 hypothetical protein [Thermosulfidibacter takaii]